MRNTFYTQKPGAIKHLLVCSVLFCLCSLSGFAQGNAVVNELISFGQHALEERWGAAAKLVLRSAVEQAPRNAQASRLYSAANEMAASQPMGKMSTRIALLNAALDAHERRMYRATKIILLELQRLEPNDPQVKMLLTKVNQAIRNAPANTTTIAATTTSTTSAATTSSTRTPYSSTTGTPTPYRSKAVTGEPTNTEFPTRTQPQATTTSSSQQYRSTQANPAPRVQAIPPPPSANTPRLNDSPSNLQTAPSTSTARTQSSMATAPSTASSNPSNNYTTRQTPAISSTTMAARAQYTSPPPPPPAPQVTPTPLPTRSTMPASTSTPTRQPAPAPTTAPIPAHGTKNSLPLSLQNKAVTTQKESFVTERVSMSDEKAFAPMHNKNVTSYANEYPDYERPYVIPALKNTAVEETEVAIITRWRDDLRVSRVVENADKSIIQIGTSAYRLGEVVLPEYYVFWRGLNPQTRTLYFVDRRGHIYKKRY